MNTLGKRGQKSVLVPAHTSQPEVPSTQKETIIQQTTSTHPTQTEFSFEKNSVLGVEPSLEQSRSQVATKTANSDSRKMLQEALLGIQFQRAQVEKKTEVEQSPESKPLTQEALLAGLHEHQYRKDVVDIPEQWEHDLEFLTKVASHNHVGFVGLPEHLRNNKELLLHFCKQGGSVFAEDLKASTMQDKEVAFALMESSPNNYRDLPADIMNEDDVINAAVEASHYNLKSVPSEKITKSKLQAWIERDQGVLSHYEDFPEKLKQDPSLTLQFLKTGNTFPPDLNTIPSCHRDNEDVMAALIERSETKTSSIFFSLPQEMQKKPKVLQAFVKKSRDNFSYELKRSKKANQSEKKRSEHGVALRHFSKEQRAYLKKHVDGFQHQELTSGSRDAVITESEILAKLEEQLSQESPTFEQAYVINGLNHCLQSMQSAGVRLRVAGTGKGEVETTAKRDFDAKKLAKLNKIVSSSLGSYKREEASMVIEEANLSDIHKQIPDELEKAVFGYTTSDYRRINQALRSGEISEEEQLYIDGISEGLRQMPSHQGIVWRGAELSDKILATYKPGEEIVEKAFTSTSYGDKPAFSVQNTYFCIQLKDEGSAGKKVEHLSAHEDEQEVLINAGTRFKVLAKEDEGDGYGKKTIVYLQEI